MLNLFFVVLMQTSWCSSSTIDRFEMQTCNNNANRCIRVSATKVTRSFFKPLFAFQKANIEIFESGAGIGKHNLSQKILAQHGYFDSQLNILVFDTKLKNSETEVDRQLIDLSRF